MRALIVEKDTSTITLLRECASGRGYEVIACTHFEEARTELMSHPPDVLLTGIQLGPFNGLHLAFLARQADPDISIFVFSAYDDPVLRQEAARCKAAYLVKPVDTAKLLQSLTH